MKLKPLHWLIIGVLILMIATSGTVVYTALKSKDPKKWTDKYNELFLSFGKLYNVRPELLKAIAMKESSLGKNKGFEPIGGTSGLMQIKLSTANWLRSLRKLAPITEVQLKDDSVQVEHAAMYMRYLLDYFKGDESKAIMSYNQGQGNTAQGKTYAAPYLAGVQNFLKELGVA